MREAKDRDGVIKEWSVVDLLVWWHHVLGIAWETNNAFENVVPYCQSGLKEPEIGRNEERLSDFRGPKSKKKKGLTNLLGYKYVLTFKKKEESPQGRATDAKTEARGQAPVAGPEGKAPTLKGLLPGPEPSGTCPGGVWTCLDSFISSYFFPMGMRTSMLCLPHHFILEAGNSCLYFACPHRGKIAKDFQKSPKALLQNCERIHFCCCKSPNLWEFVQAAPGH